MLVLLCWQTLEYADCIPFREIRPSPTTHYLMGVLMNDTKLHLLVRFQFWKMSIMFIVIGFYL